ncbi:hypothetical protein QBC37DRAFT_379316 [Rhypophila decipiens]|uniref:Uncharacterized protein n=1 Tax=Rhypophila decipiens TaxID=261697 RepID=A0AAN6XX32_9PEZI|nr:hypothetical protein QBC37DRAFT_379316 [Rhypophila decipiens]
MATAWQQWIICESILMEAQSDTLVFLNVDFELSGLQTKHWPGVSETIAACGWNPVARGPIPRDRLFTARLVAALERLAISELDEGFSVAALYAELLVDLNEAPLDREGRHEKGYRLRKQPIHFAQTNLNNPEPKGDDSSWNADFAFSGTFPPPSSDLYTRYRGDTSFNFDRLSNFNLTGAVADECDAFATMGLNVCSLGNFPWDVIPEEGRSYRGTGDIDDPDAEWFIISRVEVGQESEASNLSDHVIGHKPSVWYDSEWTTLQFGNETYWLEFHHSLCVSRVIYAQANVSMEGFPASANNNMNTKIYYYNICHLWEKNLERMEMRGWRTWRVVAGRGTRLGNDEQNNMKMNENGARERMFKDVNRWRGDVH